MGVNLQIIMKRLFMMVAGVLMSLKIGVLSLVAQGSSPPPEQSVSLTPPPAPNPRINGAKVFGARPGSPFLFKMSAAGAKPMRYLAGNLPAGLSMDPATGLISGKIEKVGEYHVALTASNNSGMASRELRIKVGEDVCLAPPMGWNSWNCWSDFVDQEKVSASAKAMVEKGLVDHGWTYINIDDTWQGLRGGKFNAIQPNEKFPDMKGLCDQVHGMGLKIGIYSTPWYMSYAGKCGGSGDTQDGVWVSPKISKKRVNGKSHWLGEFKFDDNDAKQWAEWGFDYLKYDWKPNDVPSTARMAKALRGCGRDIVYSLSNCSPLTNGSDYFRLANCYRTMGDIRDEWRTGNPLGKYEGLVDIWDYHDKWSAFSAPSHHPDPDMLILGKVAWHEKTPKPTRLTPDEQYTHISLWCLWSAPLLIGCPIDQIDDFTLGLLTNDEVLDVDQDPLCRMAKTVSNDGIRYVMVKEMEDGSKVVGLLNRGDMPVEVRAEWKALGLSGKQRVRDLWRQKDLGEFDGGFGATVNSHGVVLVRLCAAMVK